MSPLESMRLNSSKHFFTSSKGTKYLPTVAQRSTHAAERLPGEVHAEPEDAAALGLRVLLEHHGLRGELLLGLLFRLHGLRRYGVAQASGRCRAEVGLLSLKGYSCNVDRLI